MEKLVTNLYKEDGFKKIMYTSFDKNVDYDIYYNKIIDKLEKNFQTVLEDFPLVLIHKSFDTEGGFFEAARHFIYGIIFYDYKMIVYKIVETNSWNKDFEFLLEIEVEEIIKSNVHCYIDPIYDIEKVDLEISLTKDFFDRNRKYTNLDKQLTELDNEEFIKDNKLRLIDFIDLPQDIERINLLINSWVDINKNKISKINSEFELINSKVELTDETVEQFSEVNDPAFLFLKSKINGIKDGFILDSFNHFLVEGSIIKNFGKIISKSVFDYIESEFSVEKQLEFIKEKKDYLELDESIIEKKIYNLERSTVDESLNNLYTASNKVLVINNEDRYHKSPNFITIPLKEIPLSINFPPGHPSALNTYIQHPILHNHYIPIDDYEPILLKDKIDEFKYLVQCLGATEIQYNSIESLIENSSDKTHTDIKVDASRKHVGASTSVDLNEEIVQASSDESKRLERQHFHPMSKPFVPDGLIWFNHESSWKRLSQQRLNGNILHHSEVISISKSDSFSSLDLTELEVEIKAIVKGVKINYNKKREIEKRVETSKRTLVSVNFASVLDLIDLNENQTGIHKQNYFEVFNGFVELNGKLGEEGVSIFKHFASVLEIDSNDYHDFLKTIDKSHLSEADLNYLNFFKNINIDQQISDKERFLLDNLAKTFNISSEQQNYLETLT